LLIPALYYQGLKVIAMFNPVVLTNVCLWLVLSCLSYAVRADQNLPADPLQQLKTINSEELDSFRGRDSHSVITTVQSDQHLEATISNSTFSADIMNTGAITIGEHALDSFEGIGVFNIFTGHNNAVDAAVGVSIFVTE
jgi:hypothetical protein